MRVFLLGLLLSITANVYADYGWAYFFKCKVVTSDTTIVGFITGPYEYLSDSVLSRFRKDASFFERHLTTDLKKRPNTNTVDVTDFVYVHEFSGQKALYV